MSAPTDRELLERTAKAAGIKILRSRLDDPMWRDMLLADAAYANGRQGWNPLTDDGDALRLAVKLSIDPMFGAQMLDGTRVVEVLFRLAGDYETLTEPVGIDPCAATRRAIVRAAAEMAQ